MKFLSVLLIVMSLGFFSQATVSVQEINLDSKVNNLSSYHSYDFGYVFVNSIRTVNYTIRNDGYNQLRFGGARIWGAFDFNAYHNCSPNLNPGQTCNVELRFWPAREGFYSADFEIDFIPPQGQVDRITIRMTGQGLR